jgi:hypothetical protein
MKRTQRTGKTCENAFSFWLTTAARLLCQRLNVEDITDSIE